MGNTPNPVDVSFGIGNFRGASNKFGIFLQLPGLTLIESAENVKTSQGSDQGKRAASPVGSEGRRCKLTKFRMMTAEQKLSDGIWLKELIGIVYN